MEVMDKINSKYARGIIKLTSEGLTETNDWTMQRSFKSPNYTGDWEELLTIN
jgi:DNA polymerase V